MRGLEPEDICRRIGISRERYDLIVTETVECILSRKPRTLDELNEAWFGRRQTEFAHYDGHRYRSLNLNPVWEAKQGLRWPGL